MTTTCRKEETALITEYNKVLFNSPRGPLPDSFGDIHNDSVAQLRNECWLSYFNGCYVGALAATFSLICTHNLK